ncbi:MAG: hypothetical protein ABEH43_05295, partial [Flavobacteriales bacterium]
SDTMEVDITPAPTADAGSDQTVCANNSDVGLNGSVTVANGGVWSTTGGGTFADDTSLSTTYFPDSTDTANGSVDLILTTTGNGDCNPVSDTMTVTITDAPVVDAGDSPIYTCLGDTSTQLDGSSSTSSGVWNTSGSGTF